MPTGELSPQDELQIIMQGGVVECKGDLMEHARMHVLQLQSPAVRQAVEAGKASPKTIEYLQKLVQQDLAKMRTFLEDPMHAASQKLNELGFSAPGGKNG